jgi:hypothetical protein
MEDGLMELQNFLIGIEAFRRAEPRPLLMPASTQEEPTTSACFEQRPREWEAENARNLGYQFPWGQIHEERCDGDGATRPNDSVMEWHFVLSDLHAEFVRDGGNLCELSDCCVGMLERAEEHAREETSQEVFPAYLSFSEGHSLSAFSIHVSGAENLPAARTWVADVFIPGILPLVVGSARQINGEATPKRAD